jgi:hypothetical protein
MEWLRMTKPEVIIEIGGELVSTTLYGMQTYRGWSFRKDVFDQTAAELLDEELIEHSSAVVDTWEAALQLLDKDRLWFMLHPAQIHPEFRQQIWLAVEERWLAEQERSAVDSEIREIRQIKLERWRDLCDIPSASTRGRVIVK